MKQLEQIQLLVAQGEFFQAKYVSETFRGRTGIDSCYLASENTKFTIGNLVFPTSPLDESVMGNLENINLCRNSKSELMAIHIDSNIVTAWFEGITSLEDFSKALDSDEPVRGCLAGVWFE